MLKKVIAVILALLISIACAIYFGIYDFSRDNLNNKSEELVNITYTPIEGLLFENWAETEEGIISTNNDPIVFLEGNINDFVRNVRIVGDLDNYENIEIQIYYTEMEDEGFTEEKSLRIVPQTVDSDIYLSVGKDVCKLRLDIYNESGKVAKITEIEINPYKMNINITMFISVLGITFILACMSILFVFYHQNFKAYFGGLKKYRYLILDLVSKDIKTKYRRSVLGILWSVLNPLLMMLVLTAVFSNIFRFDIKDFPIYYLTGSLIFNFVSEATSSSLNSILGAAGLIKKVYIPKYIFPLEKCLFSLVNMLFSMVAIIIVYIILGITPHWTVVLFFVPMIYAFIFSFGLGLVLVTLNVFFRDTSHLWGVWITAWMYLTPIIYPMSILPEWMNVIVKLNPLYYYVEYFRDVMIYGSVPGVTENLVCIFFSGIMLVIGLVVFKRKQDKFILYI